MSEKVENRRINGEKKVGRSVLWLTAAKIWYMLTGMLLLMIFPRIGGGTDLDRAAVFGSYSVIISILNPITMMLVLGTLQAISKFVSEKNERYGFVIKKALVLQLFIGSFLALIFFLATPYMATFFKDPAIEQPLKIASLIILFYALYPVFIGGFNGIGRFGFQAFMDICFAGMKITLILGAVYLGFGVLGAISGFAITAVVMTVVSGLITLSFIKNEKTSTSKISIVDLLKFESWILVFAFCSNLLLNADLLIVKTLSTSAVEVGIYSAALQVARLPYVAVISVTFVLFPMISKVTWEKDVETARNYIFTASRYSLLIIGILAITLSACSVDVLRLVFPSLYAQGKFQLTFLSLAYMCFSMIAIYLTTITASGKPHISTFLIILVLGISAGSSWLGMKHNGTNGAAFGVMIAMMSGVVATSLYLKKWIAPGFPLFTLIKLSVSGAIVFILSSLWNPENKPLIVVKGLLVFSLFLVLLAIFKEIKKEDYNRLKKVLRLG